MRLADTITLYAEGLGFKKPKFGGHMGGHHGVKKHGAGKWHHLEKHSVKGPTQAAWSTDAEKALHVPTQASEDDSTDEKEKDDE